MNTDRELLDAFFFGINITASVLDCFPLNERGLEISKLLGEIADGTSTLVESPPNEDARHLCNVLVKQERELARRIERGLGRVTGKINLGEKEW